MKIAILGGTFNPLHLGHMLIAEDAMDAVNLDKVIFIPCSIPPHKSESDLLPGHHRMAMVQLGIAGDSRFEALSIEIDRGGPSYSVDTLRHVRQEYPHDQIFFIVGSDNFQDIGHWNRFSELVKLCEFLVIERPGCPLKLPPPSVPADQLASLKYTVFEGPTISISSSEVRRRFHEGKNVSHLIPSPVYDYARTHHLYSTTP